jgi:sortase A
MSIRRVILQVLSIAMIVAGLALIGFNFFGTDVTAGAVKKPPSRHFSIPLVYPKREAPVVRVDRPGIKVPKDKTLYMTIPAMSRVRHAAIPTASSRDVQALNDHVAIHIKGTGFPWQKHANVYIAGHRLGYVGTKSLLAFYDLNNLRKGDKVYVTDANGTRYIYRVYRKFAVYPAEIWVTRPVKGKSILTLQSCTLPNYTRRLIVRAELVKVVEAHHQHRADRTTVSR